jgi:hypothetical protein
MTQVNVILAWGTDDVSADTNGDGVVDVVDLVEVILSLGRVRIAGEVRCRLGLIEVTLRSRRVT